MDLAHINSLLSEVKDRLEYLDPQRRIEEAQRKPSEHSGKRMSAAKKRLSGLYAKLTANRSEANRLHSTGAKR